MSASRIISPSHTRVETPHERKMNNFDATFNEFQSSKSTPPSSLFAINQTPQFSPIDTSLRFKSHRNENWKMNHDVNTDGNDSDGLMNSSVSDSFLKTPTQSQESNDMIINERLNFQDSTNLGTSTHSCRQLQLRTPTKGEKYNDDSADCNEPEQRQHESNEEETEEDRHLREEADSEALARQLMAEEAMFSYNQSTQFLQQNVNEYSEEDLAALRAIMAEENPVFEGELEDAEDAMDSADMSYEALLDLGERLGDVKSERWAMIANKEIAKLPSAIFCNAMAEGKDENDSGVKCLVCQFAYEQGEKIRLLPCKHYFHHECVDQWLMAKDFCPYCRQCIVVEEAK